MSSSVTTFANVTTASETSTHSQGEIGGFIYEMISEPYTDPATGNTTEVSEVIPISGLVTITDTTASGLVIPLGTYTTYNNN